MKTHSTSNQSTSFILPSVASESCVKNKLLSFPLSLSLSLCFIAVLSACGSGGGGSGATVNVPSNSATPAAGLSYTDPKAGGWRLIKDASSTNTRVVLNLVGPTGLTVRGVGFNLSKGQCISFGQFPSGAYALDTGVFQLMGNNPNFEAFAGTPADPVLFVSAPLKSGDVLSTGIFQKDRTNAPKDVGQPLVQVAIDLSKASAASAACNAGSVIGLSVVKARVVPADIGGMDFILTTDVINKAKMADITIDVGSLVTR